MFAPDSRNLFIQLLNEYSTNAAYYSVKKQVCGVNNEMNQGVQRLSGHLFGVPDG
jgi:hypothetical protein